MNAKSNALDRVKVAYGLASDAQDEAESLRQRFAQVCVDAYNAGANDREISEAIDTALSRARIQQLRNSAVVHAA